MTADWQWFAAVLLHECQINGMTDDEALVDHQVFLLRAVDADAAHDRARALGLQKEHEYLNEAGETVGWRFLGLHDLVELGPQDVADGGEVYGWTDRGVDAWRAVAKADLTVFWEDRNGDRLASDTLDDGS